MSSNESNRESSKGFGVETKSTVSVRNDRVKIGSECNPSNTVSSCKKSLSDTKKA